MIGTITHILAKAGYKAMNGPLADERRRLAGAVSPAAYVSYDPRLLAGAGWYGYRIALKGGDRSMLERARYMLEQQYTIRDSYEYYADGVYTFGVLLRQRVPHYGIGGGGAIPEPDALNFYMPDGGTITLTKNGTPTVVELEYSIDGGATWQVWEEVGNVRSLTLAVGQKMYVRNTSETSTGFSTDSSSYYRFEFSTNAYGGGNINSLLCKLTQDAVITPNCFRRLFYSSKLCTPPEMPSVQIDEDCYYSTYYNCLLLEKAALLPANFVPARAYRFTYAECPLITSVEMHAEITGASACEQMLYNCNSLREIKVNFTDITSSNSLLIWVYGVAPSGDFYCPAELTIPTGASGIPSGWTRHDI